MGGFRRDILSRGSASPLTRRQKLILKLSETREEVILSKAGGECSEQVKGQCVGAGKEEAPLWESELHRNLGPPNQEEPNT